MENNNFSFRSNDGVFQNSYNDTFWNDLRKKAANNYIPIHGHFELTPQCNLDCKMCYVHLNKHQMNGQKELNFEEWKTIIDQAIENGMIFASLSGGECLTASYFDELYLYLKSKGILIFILTNGILLRKKISLFSEHPPALIQISMYGYDRKSYEDVTGKDEYITVSNNILELKHIGIPVSIAVTASKYLPSVYDIVKKYNDMGIGVTVNRWLMPPYESTGRYLEDINLSPEEQVKISLEICKATNQPIQPILQDALINNLPAPKKFSTDLPERKGLICAAGRSDFSINWKGEMSLCVSLNATTGLPLIEGFKEAWEKTTIASKNFLMPTECFECEYLKVCNRCPAQHLINNIHGHCNTSVCEEGVLMVKKGLIPL